MAGSISEFSADGWGLQQDVPIRLWTHNDVWFGEPAPLLLAFDGRDFEDRSLLTWYVDGRIDAGDLRPMRVALVDTPHDKRRQWLAADHEFTEVAVRSAIPAICDRAPTNDKIAALGASYGAVALMKCIYTYPGAFGAALLQSPSVFHEQLDRSHGYDLSGLESDYWKIAGFIDQVRNSGQTSSPVNIQLTVGQEPLARNFDDIKWHLAEQGHNVSGERVDGRHEWEDWGEAFYPNLGNLLQGMWGRR